MSPDRLAAISAFERLCKVQSKRRWNLICCDISPTELEKYKQHVIQLMAPARTLMDITISCALWFASRYVVCLKMIHFLFICSLHHYIKFFIISDSS